MHRKKKHMWLMLACCLIPLVWLTAIYFFHVPVNTAFLVGLVLFCPLSHLLLMAFMGGYEHAKESHTGSQIQPSELN